MRKEFLLVLGNVVEVFALGAAMGMLFWVSVSGGVPNGGVLVESFHLQPERVVARRGGNYYLMRVGDTLGGVSWYLRALGISVSEKELAEWNGIRDPHTLRPGRLLRLQPPRGTEHQMPTVLAFPELLQSELTFQEDS